MSERCTRREIWPLEQEGHRAPRLVPTKDMSIPCITDGGMELLSPHGARHHADEAVGGAGKAEVKIMRPRLEAARLMLASSRRLVVAVAGYKIIISHLSHNIGIIWSYMKGEDYADGSRQGAQGFREDFPALP